VSGFNKKRLHSSLIALAIIFSLTLPAFANGAKQPDIKNFGRINDQYYRGGQPEKQDYKALADMGIQTVINLTSDDSEADEQARVEDAGMNYVQIPMTTHVEPTEAQVKQFLAIVNNPKKQPVYVHCVGGKHRTGVMTAIYRMSQNRWSADQAYDEMKRYKFGSSLFHPEFKQFVYNYFDQMEHSKPSRTGAQPAIAGTAAH
jgi:uncharacterized protein (TIGR01244 family)